MVVQFLSLQGYCCYEAKSPVEVFEMELLEDGILAFQLVPPHSPQLLSFLPNSPLEGTQALRFSCLASDCRHSCFYACAHFPTRRRNPRFGGPAEAGAHYACATSAPPLLRRPRKRFLPTQPRQAPGSQELCLSRLVGPLLHGPVCQDCFGGRLVRQAGPRSDVWILQSVAGAGASRSPWLGSFDSGPRRRQSPAGRHGGPVPQLRVGPGAHPVADRPHAERLLRLSGPVAGAGGLAVARQPLAGPDVQRRDPGLFNPFRPALHDVLHPQRSHLCPGLAVLHPAREAVSGFHCHCPFLSSPGLLVLQLPFPLGVDLVAGPSCVHCAHGCHRGVPVHADGAQGDPPQLSP